MPAYLHKALALKYRYQFLNIYMKKSLLLVIFFPGWMNAQISIIPKIGFEYSGIAYYPKGAIKYEDIRITVPEGEGFLGAEISLTKKKQKITLAAELMNLGEGVTIYNDSAVLPNNVVVYRSASLLTGGSIVFLGIFYDRVSTPIKNTRLSFFYGCGTGIGFNKNEEYYRTAQDAGYSSAYFGGDNPISIQRWAKPIGHGIFLKLRGGISLLNKKSREIIILEFFWRQGFIKMNEYTVDYSYTYVGAPGSGHSVTGYRFNSRGTTFGSTLGFPIYFSKNKKKKNE